MENSQIQKYLVKAWAKMELNSFYGFPSIPVISMEYDENKAHQITEEGKNNLMAVQDSLKNVL